MSENQNLEEKDSEKKSIGNNLSYGEFLELLKMEFGDFLRLAENGRSIPYAGLKARKKSICIRELLKDFRDISINREKMIKEVRKNIKTKLEKGEF